MSSEGNNGNGGNGGNGHPIFHFWSVPRTSVEDDKDDLEEDKQPEPMEEYHLDCRGKKRLFRIQQYGGGTARFLSAQEVRDDEHAGLRVVLQFNDETEPPPYWQLRKRIAQRLATRHVVRNPDTEQLEILNMLIRAQVSYADDEATGPDLVIDDEVVSWEELGGLLRSYEGWGLRIQVIDAGEE